MAHFNRLGWARIAVALLLVIAGFVAGQHHHADAAVHADCSVCVVASAPAQVSDAVAPPAPSFIILESVELEAPRPPFDLAPREICTRGPPSDLS